MTLQVFTSDKKEVPLQLSTFPGGEEHVRIGLDQTEQTYIVQARITNSSELMRLLVLDNAFHQQRRKYTLHMPYLPYARQDRVCNVGEAFSIEVLGDLLKNLKACEGFKTADVHSNISFNWVAMSDSLTQAHIISKWTALVDFILNPNEKVVLVSPDSGAMHKTKMVADLLGVESIQAMKVRDPLTTHILETKVTGKINPECHYLIVDDICDGGRTFIELSKALKEKGATKVSLYVTHGIFSNGLAVFEGHLDSVWTTNSFYPRYYSTVGSVCCFTFDIFSIL